jgi:hypothetical protein
MSETLTVRRAMWVRNEPAEEPNNLTGEPGRLCTGVFLGDSRAKS